MRGLQATLGAFLAEQQELEEQTQQLEATWRHALAETQDADMTVQLAEVCAKRDWVGCDRLLTKGVCCLLY